MTERAASSPRGAGSLADALARVPAELKAEARWVCWRRETRGGKTTKLHGPGDLGDLRGGRGGRRALALRRRGVRLRAGPRLHGARPRPRDFGWRPRPRVPLGGGRGGHLHGGLAIRRRPASDLPGREARRRRALAQGPARRARGGDVRPRPLLHGDGGRLRGVRGSGLQPRGRREGVPDVDRAGACRRAAAALGGAHGRRGHGRRGTARAHVRLPQRRRDPRPHGRRLLGAGRRPLGGRHGAVQPPRVLVRGRRDAH